MFKKSVSRRPVDSTEGRSRVGKRTGTDCIVQERTKRSTETASTEIRTCTVQERTKDDTGEGVELNSVRNVNHVSNPRVGVTLNYPAAEENISFIEVGCLQHVIDFPSIHMRTDSSLSSLKGAIVVQCVSGDADYSIRRWRKPS